ncbi:unnamed protein product, partial [Didymodactylos carnosus]
RRLATKIIIKDEKSSNTCVNKCSLHGRCLFYENNKNQFCFCNEGWTGELCDKKLNVSWGSLCQNVKKYKEIFVGIKDEWNNRIINKIPLMLVYFASNEKLIVSITVDEWYLYKDVHLNMLKKVTYKSVPKFVFVQTYFDTQYDTFYGSYYLVAYLPSDLPKSLTTNILGSNRCPYVGELLKNKTIMSYPYLKRIKFYYRPCLVLGTHCFYDERYMCLCNNEAFFDCFYFNHSASNCTHLKYCLNGGYCLQATKEKDFGCVCPKCYYGSICQFTVTKYLVSLDALLGQDIVPDRSISRQTNIIKLNLALVVLMIIFGFVGNVLSIITFSRPKTREMGCDYHCNQRENGEKSSEKIVFSNILVIHMELEPNILSFYSPSNSTFVVKKEKLGHFLF